MFTNPDFLSTVGAGVVVGLLVMFWISKPFRLAMKAAGVDESAVAFWSAVVQLCSLLVPILATLLAQHNILPYHRELTASTIAIAACFGGLTVVLTASIIVAWATPEAKSFNLSQSDSNELKQLLLRMRDFRAQEIVRSSEAAGKVAQN